MPPSVNTHGPHVTRPDPTTAWRVIHHWGTQLGDETEYRISVSGDRVRIYSTKCDVDVPREVAERIHRALGDALAWNPE